MTSDEIRLLFDYNYWANHQVLAAAGQVSAGQLTAPAPLSHGSLFGTLAHVLGAEIVWRVRCQEGVSPPAVPVATDFSSLDALQSRWQVEEQAMRAYLAGLRSADLESTVSYINTRGVAFHTVLWQILVHVVNHGTQFRSEAAVLLTQYGQSPGDLDLIRYTRSGK